MKKDPRALGIQVPTITLNKGEVSGSTLPHPFFTKHFIFLFLFYKTIEHLILTNFYKGKLFETQR